MSFNLGSCAHYTLMDFSPIVDLSRSLKTNIFVKFAPLWNVMRSCLYYADLDRVSPNVNPDSD